MWFIFVPLDVFVVVDGLFLLKDLVKSGGDRLLREWSSVAPVIISRILDPEPVIRNFIMQIFKMSSFPCSQVRAVRRYIKYRCIPR